jgi:hypothetical protein
MKQWPCLFFSLCLVPLTVNIFASPSQAQTNSRGQVTNTLTLEKEGKEPTEFSINGTENRVNPAAIVGAITLSAGVDIDAAQTGINLSLAGADPESVANLLLALSGVAENNQVDATRLASAINAFNSIVDKADLATLTALKELPEFIDIRTFLAELRKPIG